MKCTMPALVVVMWCALGSPIADAAPDAAPIALAKSHFEKGNAAYNLGKFDEAVSWFTRAYEAWPAPDFLYNIAQSYRLAGNCKQALFVYKRYLSIREKDQDAPLRKDERSEIERFIKELTDCAAKTDALAAAQPDSVSIPRSTPQPAAPPPAPSPIPTPPRPAPPRPAPPPAHPVTQGPSTPTPQPPVTTTTSRPTVTAAVDQEPEAEHDDQDPEVPTNTPPNATLLSAYATGGIAVFSTGGDLQIPVQPSFAVGAGYPLLIGPLMLDIGARVSYSPIQYHAVDGAKAASLIGIRATAGATYRVNDKLSVRGDAGIGVAMLRGLADRNPFTDTGAAGAFTMPSVRVGVAAEYAVTANLVATVAPLSFGFSLAPDGLAINSLLQFDVLIGVGYRM